MGPVPKRLSLRAESTRKWRSDAHMVQRRRPRRKAHARGLETQTGAVARIARSHESGPGMTIQRMMYTMVPGNAMLTSERTT